MEAQVSAWQTTILTLAMDDASESTFESLRQRHYPAALNRIPAHLTLFHTLPAAEQSAAVVAAAAAAYAPFAMRVTGLRSLGRGVAFALASEELAKLHASLAGEFAEVLTAQDRQRFTPHVVIQNKPKPGAARALLAEIQKEFEPFQVTATGLTLWKYLGGPWERVETFAFGANVSRA